MRPRKRKNTLPALAAPTARRRAWLSGAITCQQAPTNRVQGAQRPGGWGAWGKGSAFPPGTAERPSQNARSEVPYDASAGTFTSLIQPWASGAVPYWIATIASYSFCVSGPVSPPLMVIFSPL